MIFSSISSVSLANDENAEKNDWLVKFLSKDLTTATADITTENQGDYLEKEWLKIHFDFETKVYAIDQYIQYESDWATLTNNGADNPPKVKAKLPGSTLNPWTKKGDKGIFEETLKKQVPNWLVFNQLQGLLNTIAISDYSPAPNGMFRDDELKYLKKMYKSREVSSMSVWRQLAFDAKGNIIGVSSDYLKGKLKIEAEYNYVSVFNTNNEEIKLSPVKSELPAIVSAVLIEKGNDRLIVLNSELNFILHKFSALIFPDPNKVKMDYFKVFDSKVKKGLDRFENRLATK